MALPIAPTPELDERDSERFVTNVETDSGKPSHPIPTPRLKEIEARIRSNDKLWTR